MKTVKRKAEVGERILIPHTGERFAVKHVDDSIVMVDGLNVGIYHHAYEVIDEEPSIPPHSSHYHQNGLDPLEVMRRTFPPEQYEGFLRGSLLKYTMRYDRKGQEAEDLEKAEFYSEALKRWKEGAADE